MLQYRYGFSAVCTVFCTEHRGLVLPSVQTTARIQSNTTESVTCRSRTVGRAAKMQTQNEIDDLTMQIKVFVWKLIYLRLIASKDPSRVRGSGYIQFPPQRPFATPVIVQPPTICVRNFVTYTVSSYPNLIPSNPRTFVHRFHGPNLQWLEHLRWSLHGVCLPKCMNLRVRVWSRLSVQRYAQHGFVLFRSEKLPDSRASQHQSSATSRLTWSCRVRSQRDYARRSEIIHSNLLFTWNNIQYSNRYTYSYRY
jgi:hypothetical protein